VLETANTALVLVDVQVKLACAMHGRESLIENLGKLVKGLLVLEVPIVWCEQNPRGLGQTVPEIARLVPGEPITKMSFNCMGEGAFREALERLGRGQILIAGIESHVCVYQTALDLLARGYEVQVVGDAVSSRRPENMRIALAKMRDAGASVTSVETSLFELLKTAEGERFKKILEIVK